MKKNIFASTMKYNQKTKPFTKTITNMQISTQQPTLPTTTKMNYMNNTISMINIQKTTISEYLTNLKKNQKEIENLIKNNNDICFSRISNLDINKMCINCKRPAVYTDTESNYYCWFHRSEKEN